MLQVIPHANFRQLIYKSFKNDCPINSLPMELLTRIFREALKPCKEQDYLSALIDIAHTCANWREAAIEDAFLWTTIDASSVEMAKTFIKHSRSRPLSFVYESKLLATDKHNIFMEILGENLQRVDSLRLDNRDGNLLYTLFEILRTPLEHIHELQIDMDCSRSKFPYTTDPPIDLALYLQEGYKNLNRIYFSGPFIIPANFWNKLTYLSLASTTPVDSNHPNLTLIQFLDLLEGNPGLVRLKLKSVNPQADVKCKRCVRMPNLKKVTLKTRKRGDIRALIPHFLDHLGIKIPLVTKISDRFIVYIAPPDDLNLGINIPLNIRLDPIRSVEIKLIDREEGVLVFDNKDALKATIGNEAAQNLDDFLRALKNANSIHVVASSAFQRRFLPLRHLPLLQDLHISTRQDSSHLFEWFLKVFEETKDWPRIERVRIFSHNSKGHAKDMNKAIPRPQLSKIAIVQLSTTSQALNLAGMSGEWKE